MRQVVGLLCRFVSHLSGIQSCQQVTSRSSLGCRVCPLHLNVRYWLSAYCIAFRLYAFCIAVIHTLREKGLSLIVLTGQDT